MNNGVRQAREHTRRWTGEALRFGLVGVVGFGVDALALLAAIHLGGMDLYRARVVSYLAAATTTWFLNRRFTFVSTSTQLGSQWLRFLTVNAAGGAVNYTVYALLVYLSQPFRDAPVLAVAVGSLTGFLLNFAGSKWLVFGARPGAKLR
ncbi:GtrA family protein [Thioalkalivibrio nitratireducens]|uniref:GtrA family protein n=1 Tax=Thioalkalivibrio nitratireducens TaxID=186931 RepID=UPI0009F8B005